MSVEYRLEATGDPVVVADLGITVGRHEVWVSREDLKASDCLQVLIRLGKVRVSSGARSRVSKEPPKNRLPTFVSRSRPNGRTPVPKQELHTVTQEEANEMADRAAKKAAEDAVRMAVEALMPAIHSLRQAPASDIDSRIEQAVVRALSTIHLTAPSGAAPTIKPIPSHVVGPDEPLFIPTGIVKDAAENFSVKADTVQSEGLDDAANALKVLRKGKGGSKK